MSKRSTPPAGKQSGKAIRHTLNSIRIAIRRETNTKHLLKLCEYRDKLLKELSEVEVTEKKKQETEQIKARLAEIESASTGTKTSV